MASSHVHVSTSSPSGGGDSISRADGSPDTGRIRQALAHWSAGNFDACIAELDELGLTRHTSESIFLRARALLRMHKIGEAEKWLLMMETRHLTEDAIATHAMLLGNACARRSNFGDAKVLFDRAVAVGPHPTIVAETAYYHALALWQARNYRLARVVLEPALGANQDIVSARGHQLLGFIATAEGKFAEAHTHFEAALEALGSCVGSDLHLEATLLHQLAIGGAEIELRDPTRLDERVRKLSWTSNLVMEHVQSLRHVGLAYARLGEPELAITRFVEAAGVMPRSPWTIVGLAEAANLCYRLNEPVGAAGYVSAARNVADQDVIWDAVEGEARLALLQLATAVARSGDGSQARRYLDLYNGPDNSGARLPALSALNMDSRLQCLEQHADGIVRGALQGQDAVPVLSEVSCAWRRLKYRFRADEAREDIRAITHRSYDFGPQVVGARRQASPLPQDVDGDGEQETRYDPQLFGFATAQGMRMSLFVGESRKPKTVTMTMQQDRIIRLLIIGKNDRRYRTRAVARAEDRSKPSRQSLRDVRGKGSIPTHRGDPRRFSLTQVLCRVGRVISPGSGTSSRDNCPCGHREN